MYDEEQCDYNYELYKKKENIEKIKMIAILKTDELFSFCNIAESYLTKDKYTPIYKDILKLKKYTKKQHRLIVFHLVNNLGYGNINAILKKLKKRR